MNRARAIAARHRLPGLVAATPLFLLAISLLGCRKDKESAGAPTSGKLDVLLVTLDTTRADHIGAFGGPKDLTPNMDALAADAARFQRCIAQSSATPISHASILTGLNPHHHFVRVILAKSGYRLPEDVPYLPEILKRAGWLTGAFLSSFTVSEFYAFDRGFDKYDSGTKTPSDSSMQLQPDGSYKWDMHANQRRSDKTTDRAIQWLNGINPDQAFALWVHYWDPHDFFPTIAETLPPHALLAPFLKDLQAGSVEYKRAVYRAEVAYMDQQFGRLIDKLKAMGRFDNTVIVVVADHGQGLGQHDWWDHRILYQEQIHLPLFVRVPGWPTGQDIHSQVRSIDIFPTVLEALGFDDRGGMDGKTLRLLMHGQVDAPRLAYAESISKFDLNARVIQQLPTSGNMYCLMDEKWKLIWRLDYPEDSELYDLSLDRAETHNLLRAEPGHTERLRTLLEDMKVFRTAPFPDMGENPTAAEIRALVTMGYIDDDEGENPSGGTKGGDPSRPDLDPAGRPSPSAEPTTQPAVSGEPRPEPTTQPAADQGQRRQPTTQPASGA
jgi:arylsulfatase A-like enzyme